MSAPSAAGGGGGADPRGAVALPVDELLGNQQVMLKPLHGPLSHIRAAAGCGMLRTGDVAIALDCERLVA
jgi:two-component system chemotaxis sensor kinase CheA